MADEFDSQKLERLLTRLAESTYAAAQNVEKITSPEVFGATNDAQPSSLLDGNTPLPGPVDVAVDPVRPAGDPQDQGDFDSLRFETEPLQAAMQDPQIPQADPALGAIDYATVDPLLAGGGGFDSPPGAFDSGMDTLSLDTQVSNFQGGFNEFEGLQGRPADYASGVGSQVSIGEARANLESEATPDYTREGEATSLAGAQVSSDWTPPGDAGNPTEAAAVTSDAEATVSWPPMPDFDNPEAFFGPADLGYKDTVRTESGQQHIYDGDDADNILDVIKEFQDQSRDWRRMLIDILRAMVSDLRQDNALLADVRRHFEQSRRAY